MLNVYNMFPPLARQREPDKCLQVWTSMQEEGVVPKDRTLRYLANILRSYDKPIPFEVPQVNASNAKFFWTLSLGCQHGWALFMQDLDNLL